VSDSSICWRRELAVIAAALGIGAYHLRALLVPAWDGALARLAEIVIGISMLILVSELIGVLSLFEEVPLVLGSVLAGLGATFLGVVADCPRPPRLRGPVQPLMVAIGIAAAVLVVVHWAHPTGQALDQGMYYRTPPGTTCPSRPGSRRWPRSARFTSPIAQARGLVLPAELGASPRRRDRRRSTPTSSRR